MYFTYTFTWLLRRKEVILTQSSLPCESSDKFAPNFKIVASNNEVIVTDWPLKNTFSSFISVILLFLNY